MFTVRIVFNGTLSSYMKKEIVIYYDPDCGFCEKACISIKKFLFLKNAEIRIITTDKEAYKIFQDEYSWAVYESATGKYYSKSKAWWRLVRASPFSILYLVSLIPGVGWLGDRVYDKVANSRPKTCKS